VSGDKRLQMRQGVASFSLFPFFAPILSYRSAWKLLLEPDIIFLSEQNDGLRR
jgi:hypothetical protein